MKIRHEAPLLPMGWILAVPPDSTVPHSVDPATTTSRWSHLVESAHAIDCRRAAVVALKSKHPEFPAPLDPTSKLTRFNKQQPADPQLAHPRVSNATCIAFDDPIHRQVRETKR
jgi:hypothetical protein